MLKLDQSEPRKDLEPLDLHHSPLESFQKVDSAYKPLNHHLLITVHHGIIPKSTAT